MNLEIKPYFGGEWAERDRYGREPLEAIADEFKIELTNEQVVFAAYDTPPYEGYATVLLLTNGKLYEVAGSHCSCYGLEGQWSPEETTVKALRMRRYYSHDVTEDGWLRVLADLEKAGL